jgi:3-deoxy-D-manno-octulosonic-acid transferase
MLFVYNAIIVFTSIITLPLIILWLLFSAKRRQTFFKRLGWGRLPLAESGSVGANPTRTVWIHALSVGEVLSAVPIVSALAETAEHGRLVFTASTKTGYDIALQRLGRQVSTIVYFPYDIFFALNRRLNQINPSAIIIVETDIWPGFLNAASKRGIPVVLVNARLSDRSYSGYARFRALFAPALRSFRCIGVQTDRDGERFMSLGVSPDSVCRTGNIKFDPPPLMHPPMSGRELKQMTGLPPNSRLFLTGSIHPEEEVLLLDAFNMIKTAVPEAALITAPRNPQRAEKIARLFSSSQKTVRYLHQSQQPATEGHTEIVIVDKMGVLRDLYAGCDVAFVGGSLCTAGGHNPLEPAEFGKPVLFGPDMRDFREIADLLISAGGARTVSSARDLADAVIALFKAPRKADQMGAKARHVFLSNQGALERTLEIINHHAIIDL